uniref:Uncharacterized protein n=1 Tax=Sphingobacterium sp. (strain 21) TaxID=743722 RepID=F4CC15_SPHS2
MTDSTPQLKDKYQSQHFTSMASFTIDLEIKTDFRLRSNFQSFSKHANTVYFLSLI